MSRIPEEIPGLGKPSERLRQNPEFDPTVYDFDQDSYFVWSRLDGYTATRDVILMVGFPIAHTIQILGALRSVGAILKPGEAPAQVAHLVAQARKARAARPPSATQSAATQSAATPSAATPSATPSAATQSATTRSAATRSAAHKAAGQDTDAASAKTRTAAPARAPGSGNPDAGAPDEAQLTDEEQAAMSASVDLGDEVKRRIITMRRRVRSADYFVLLEVARDVDARDLKRAYFRLSKEFHPDRYYRKNTGPFGPWLAQIFETLSKAFEVLADATSRQRYLASMTGEHLSTSSAQTRTEYARDLFERACTAETGGDMEGALKLFAAAIRVDAQPRYLSRAALCATSAGELPAAEEYAKKAASLEPESPSYARILADVYRASGKLEQAEKTLVHALGLKSENDILAKELAADLSDVRADLARRSPRTNSDEPAH